MLPININRNPCMGSLKTLSHFTLSGLEFKRQGHSDFEALYLVKEQIMLMYMLLFSINRKAYVGSPLIQLHLTLVTLIGRGQGHSDFETYLVKQQS